MKVTFVISEGEQRAAPASATPLRAPSSACWAPEGTQSELQQEQQGLEFLPEMSLRLTVVSSQRQRAPSTREPGTEDQLHLSCPAEGITYLSSANYWHGG